MTTLDNAPLLESIFELRWGELRPGEFSYKEDEQLLFAGKISASAQALGFGFVERVNDSMLASLPMLIGHRYREKADSWPCYQVGLGIFTANQNYENYDWDSFRRAIEKGLEILKRAEESKLESIRESLHLVLRYQDGFFPNDEGSITEYLEQHFNVKVRLSEEFLNSASLDHRKSSVNIKINVDSVTPKGTVTVVIANAIINNRPGLLMETVVISKAKEALGEKIGIAEILNWCDQAHDLQKHSFKTLISPSAYKK